MYILMLILKAFYFCLPAYLANMSPVIINKIGILKFLNKPIDAGKVWAGKPILGKGKTWRGLVAGVIVAVAVAWLQKILAYYHPLSAINIVDFDQVSFFLFGFLGGLGAMLGDTVKSFFKRRAGIASGKAWPVFDQLDFVAGYFIFVYLLAQPPVEIIVTAFLITLILHPLTNIIGYALKIKKVWW